MDLKVLEKEKMGIKDWFKIGKRGQKISEENLEGNSIPTKKFHASGGGTGGTIVERVDEKERVKSINYENLFSNEELEKITLRIKQVVSYEEIREDNYDEKFNNFIHSSKEEFKIGSGKYLVDILILGQDIGISKIHCGFRKKDNGLEFFDQSVSGGILTIEETQFLPKVDQRFAEKSGVVKVSFEPQYENTEPLERKIRVFQIIDKNALSEFKNYTFPNEPVLKIRYPLGTTRIKIHPKKFDSEKHFKQEYLNEIGLSLEDLAKYPGETYGRKLYNYLFLTKGTEEVENYLRRFFTQDVYALWLTATIPLRILHQIHYYGLQLLENEK